MLIVNYPNFFLQVQGATAVAQCSRDTVMEEKVTVPVIARLQVTQRKRAPMIHFLPKLALIIHWHEKTMNTIMVLGIIGGEEPDNKTRGKAF